jgi:hypothetical protein
MKEKVQKILNFVKDYISWIIAIGSLILGIIGLRKDASFSNTVVYLIIIIDTFILLGLGALFIVSYYYNISNSEKYEININELLQEKKELYNTIDNLKKSYNVINVDYDYIIGTLNKFLNKLSLFKDNYINKQNSLSEEKKSMIEHDYKPHEIDEKITQLTKDNIKNISNSIIEDYNHFMGIVTKRCKNIVENYLESKGYILEVSITVKLLLNPELLGDLHNYCTVPYVYTSFRDFKSINIRNKIADFLFTIMNNTDFNTCVNRKSFIFNNKSKNSTDYLNEESDFYNFYDSGSTACVASKVEMLNDQRLYGFITCDVLNDKYGNVEIIDNNVSTILSCLGKIISTYFEYLDLTWCSCNLSEKNFWTTLYNTLHNNNKRC